MKILIIANARWKDGMSGSDNIYMMFLKYWDIDQEDSRIMDMMKIDYKPFWLCYFGRIVRSIWEALSMKNEFDFVYSSSDFMMDVFPAWILKKRGKVRKWVAGFYMVAPKQNRIYYFTQKLTKHLITKFADVVIVTNPTLYKEFPNKVKTWINGGIDISKTGFSNEKKIYDAVFVGRIHPTKGIDELIDIWEKVVEKKPEARLAIIGDGDLGMDYIREKIGACYKRGNRLNIEVFGHLVDERFDVFKKSKVVLYPTPKKYDHFSMSPIEAMACGCPMMCFDLKSVARMDPKSTIAAYDGDYEYFADNIMLMIESNSYKALQDEAREWALKFEERKEALRVENFLKEVL